MSVFSLLSKTSGLIFCTMLLACSPSAPTPPDSNEEVILFSGPTMGTSYSVKIVADVEEIDVEALKHDVDARLLQLNQVFSTYIDDSELMLLNQAPLDVAVPISNDLFKVLSFSQSLTKDSNGYFDMTIRPLVELWGFGKKAREGEILPQSEVDLALAKIGKNKDIELSVIQQSAIKYEPLSIDLSATAKGYAVDEIAKLVRNKGIENYLVEIGGELRAEGEKSDSKPWVIGIEKPLVEARAIEQLVKLENISMATSGDYRNYFEVDGRRLSHIIDPKTGYPVEHKLASATVLNEDCMVADGLATAMLAMGEHYAKQLALRFNSPVYLIIKTEDGFETWYNPLMKPYLLELDE